MHGLQNLGNTCYVNTVLQCLSCFPDFIQSIRTKSTFSPSIKNISGIVNTQYKIFLTQQLKPDNTIISPKLLIASLQHFVRNSESSNIHTTITNITSQNDAHEFILLFLSILHETTKEKVSINISGQVESKEDEDIHAAMKAYKRFHEKEYSIITKCFTGQYISSLLNVDENEVSKIFEPFTCIEVEIPSMMSMPSIYDCFNHFTKNEKIDGRNQYKSIRFWKLPDILIVTIKRFNNMGKKNNQHVKIFPEICMEHYCAGPDKHRSKYKLKAICNHTGSVSGGHYYAYCYSDKKKEWFLANDAMIRPIRTTTISTSQAYCLFYEKI